MYKVFSGEKCILISGKEERQPGKHTKVIAFRTAEDLHREYMLFARSSSLKKLIITGEPGTVWKVFRSLFRYIEAAGGAVVNGKGELLMIYRNRHWDLPKGKMEKDETPSETALREVEEECGVKQLKIERKLIMTHHVFFLDKVACIKRTYWYQMSTRDTARPRPQAEEGILKAEWLSREEVKKVRNKIYFSLQDVLIASAFLS